MTVRIVRHGDWAGLAERAAEVDEDVWPEYNRHGDVLGPLWRPLLTDFAQFQFLLHDDSTDELLAEAHTIPVYWNGDPEDLLSGIDAAMEQGFQLRAEGRAPNALCALGAEVPPEFQGRGLARAVLDAMVSVAAEAGLEYLIAPVRPSWKERYPITPIDRYIKWTRSDGEPFDPWIRVHARMGGRVLTPLPRSMLITGTPREWEEWVGIGFPETGTYVFPHGLAPLEVNVEADNCVYWEPNVWIAHSVTGTL